MEEGDSRWAGLGVGRSEEAGRVAYSEHGDMELEITSQLALGLAGWQWGFLS